MGVKSNPCPIDIPILDGRFMSLDIGFYLQLTDKMAMNMVSHSGHVKVGLRSPIRSGVGKSVSPKRLENHRVFH